MQQLGMWPDLGPDAAPALAESLKSPEPMDGADDITGLPLDALLLEGDNATWNPDDWMWDPYQAFAEPKDRPNCRNCQALNGFNSLNKRRRTAAPGAAQPGGLAACPPGMGHLQQQQQQQQGLLAAQQHACPAHMHEAALGLGLQQHEMFCSAAGHDSMLPQLQHHNPALATEIPLYSANPFQTPSYPPFYPLQQQNTLQQPPTTAADLSIAPPAAQFPAPSVPFPTPGTATHHQHLQPPAGPPAPAPHACSSRPHCTLGLTPTLAALHTDPHSLPLDPPHPNLHPRLAPHDSPASLPSSLLSAPCSSTTSPNPPAASPSSPAPPTHPPPGPAAPPVTFTDYIRELCAAATAGRATNAIAPLATPAAAPWPSPAPLPLSLQSAPPPTIETPSTHPAAAWATPLDPPLGGGEESRGSVDRPTERKVGADRDADKDTAGSGASNAAVGDEQGKMLCQVPGCRRNLAALKDYHQRYRICDVHIKLPQVLKDGRLQRFCQQCGRFHDLAAFDGIRKSCRHQLLKHNARRRRRALQLAPTPADAAPATADAAAATAAAAAPAAPATSAAAPAVAVVEEHCAAGGAGPDAAASAGASCCSGAHAAPALAVLAAPAQAAAMLAAEHAMEHAGKQEEEEVEEVEEEEGCGVAEAAVEHAGKQEEEEAEAEQEGVGAKAAAREEGPLLGCGEGREDSLGGQRGPVHGGRESEGGAGRKEEQEQEQEHSEALEADMPGSTEVSRILHSLMSNPEQLTAMRLLLGVPTHPALPPLSPLPAPAAPCTEQQPQQQQQAEGQAAAAAPSTYDMARSMLDSKSSGGLPYSSRSPVMRLSMKLFNRTPADLPGDLRGQVTGWLQGAPPAMEAYIRPGCVFLTFNMLLEAAEAGRAQRTGPEQLVRTLLATGHPCWTEGVSIIQIADQIAILADGQVLQTLTMTPELLTTLQLPSITSYAPVIAVDPPGDDGPPADPLSVTLTLEGYNLDLPDCQLICREAGRQLPVEILSTEALPASPSTPPLNDTPSAPLSPLRAATSAPPPARSPRVRAAAASPGAPPAQAGADPPLPAKVRQVVRIKGSSGSGVIFLEFARGAFLSEAKPLLLVDDAAVARELSRLPPSVVNPDLLSDIGLLLQHSRTPKPTPSPLPSPTLTTAAPAPAAAPRLLPPEALPPLARRLLVFACDEGLPHLAMMLLPLCHDPALPPAIAIQDAIAAPLPDDPLSLLHHAVRSDSLELLQALLHWGLSHSHAWRVHSGGPGGISPLHMAALKPDGGAALLALLDHCPADAFTSARADDGVTPFHLALQMGHFALDSLLPLLVDPLEATVKELPSDEDGKVPADLPAPAAPEEGPAPAKRARGQLPPCGRCHSATSPLLLSVAAHCSRCGTRRPTLANQAGDQCCSEDELAGLHGQRPCDFCVALHLNPLFSVCGHDCPTRFDITALCQGCHASRRLEAR